MTLPLVCSTIFVEPGIVNDIVCSDRRIVLVMCDIVVASSINGNDSNMPYVRPLIRRCLRLRVNSN